MSIPRNSCARTRLVFLSDTHNATPKSAFNLPKGDVLIHAGDLTKNGTRGELEKALDWINKADFQVKIVVGGNHDLGLDWSVNDLVQRTDTTVVPEQSGVEDETSSVSNRNEKLTREEIKERWPTVRYLEHEEALIELQRPPYTIFKLFASPFSPLLDFDTDREHSNELSSRSKNKVSFSAFTYPHASSPSVLSATDSFPVFSTKDSSSLYENPWLAIPDSVDILVTHAPPHSHVDLGKTLVFNKASSEVSSEPPSQGSDTFSMQRRQMGCSHLLEAVARVKPRLHVCGHAHESRGAEMLRWGGTGASISCETTIRDNEQEAKSPSTAVKTCTAPKTWTWTDPSAGTRKESKLNLTSKGNGKTLWTERLRNAQSRDSQLKSCTEGALVPKSHLNTDAKQDGEAQQPGKLETCIVNASIMKSSWPYPKGESRYNKPIVVAIDLPIWRDGDDGGDDGEREKDGR